MSFQCGVQIYVSNYFAVDYNKCPPIKQRARVVDAAAGSQNFGFLNIIKFDSEFAAVAQGATH